MNKKELDLLMRKIAVGDDNAFALLYEKTKRGVFAFVYSYLQNYADTEDVMQETFIAVKQKAKLYKPNTDARAWILQIAKNLSLDELRKRKQRIEKAETIHNEPYEEPRIPFLDELTKTLSDKEREIVLLHAVWNYKHKEIADMKELPLGTVTWIYKTALAKLKKELEKENEEV